MVRKIFLLRHGEAAFPDQGMKDIDRPLTEAGSNQIRLLGSNLKPFASTIDLIYCSSALRTRETLRCLIEGSGINCEIDIREDIYESSVGRLFEVISNTENSAQVILLIGHNPGISFFAEYLTGDNIGNMSPGQMVKLEFALGSWDELSKGVCSLIQ